MIPLRELYPNYLRHVVQSARLFRHQSSIDDNAASLFVTLPQYAPRQVTESKSGELRKIEIVPRIQRDLRNLYPAALAQIRS